MIEKVKRIVRCPRCGQQTVWQGNSYKPFCSEFCQLTDLGRWANEDYSIAGDPTPSEDESSGY